MMDHNAVIEPLTPKIESLHNLLNKQNARRAIFSDHSESDPSDESCVDGENCDTNANPVKSFHVKHHFLKLRDSHSNKNNVKENKQLNNIRHYVIHLVVFFLGKDDLFKSAKTNYILHRIVETKRQKKCSMNKDTQRKEKTHDNHNILLYCMINYISVLYLKYLLLAHNVYPH